MSEIANVTKKPQGAKASADLLSSASFVDAYLAIKCGLVSGLDCLCDPYVMQSARHLIERFNAEERDILLRSLCGCVVRPVQETVVPTLASTEAEPTQPVPVVHTEPIASCPDGLPKVGTYTSMR